MAKILLEWARKTQLVIWGHFETVRVFIQILCILFKNQILPYFSIYPPTPCPALNNEVLQRLNMTEQ